MSSSVVKRDRPMRIAPSIVFASSPTASSTWLRPPFLQAELRETYTPRASKKFISTSLRQPGSDMLRICGALSAEDMTRSSGNIPLQTAHRALAQRRHARDILLHSGVRYLTRRAESRDLRHSLSPRAHPALLAAAHDERLQLQPRAYVQRADALRGVDLVPAVLIMSAPAFSRGMVPS